MLNDILNEVKDKSKKIQEGFIKEISKLRTGRASISVLDGIMVEYYGTPTPLNQVANLSVPEANLIVIQPWENKIIPEVEKAVRSANIGLNPISDGKIVRLPVPPLDEQRRLEIIKTLKKYAEERKTAVRNARRDCRDMVKALQEDKDISEDQEKKAYDDIQKIIDEAIKGIDSISKEREKIILED